MNTAEICFKIANTLVLPAWFLLIFFPNSKLTNWAVKNGAVSLILSLGYLVAFALHYLDDPKGGFNSLSDVRLLFSNDWALLAGWIHYLAFDLFIASQFVDYFKNKPVLRAIAMFLTFMLGPVGFLFLKTFSTKTEFKKG